MKGLIWAGTSHKFSFQHGRCLLDFYRYNITEAKVRCTIIMNKLFLDVDDRNFCHLLFALQPYFMFQTSMTHAKNCDMMALKVMANLKKDIINFVTHDGYITTLII